MMAIRGWGSYLHLVLKVREVCRNPPNPVDLRSITVLLAGSPSNLCNWSSSVASVQDQTDHAPALTGSSGCHLTWSKAAPLTRIAQAVRAILLASATTTTL